jgi:hypothetical protein
VASMKFRVFWDVLLCSPVDVDRLMMETVCTSGMSVNTYLTTRQYIPEDSKLYMLEVQNYLLGSTSQKTILNFILAAVRT